MFRILFALFTFFSLANSQPTQSHTCNVLALAGAGSAGAWEAGVISQIYKTIPNWDMITGVSSGALNAGILSSLTTDEEKDVGRTLKDLWGSIQDSDIYEPFYFVNGMKDQTGKNYMGEDNFIYFDDFKDISATFANKIRSIF